MQYQPHIGEIQPIIEAMTAKYPQLYTRAQRAEAILLNGTFDFITGAWYVPSARDPEAAYRVEDQGCNCPDFANGAPVIDGRKLCKHRIAVDAFTAILTAHLNYYPSINVDFDFNVITQTGDHVCRCQELADASVVFERSHDAAKFSKWLHTVPAVRIPVEILTDWTPDTENGGIFFINPQTGELQNV